MAHFLVKNARNVFEIWKYVMDGGPSSTSWGHFQKKNFKLKQSFMSLTQKKKKKRNNP